MHLLLLLFLISQIFFVYQLNAETVLPSTSYSSNFLKWSEDDWIERHFLINKPFIFNHQRYEHIVVRTRMNQWSLEFSYGNQSHLNKFWTELHLYFDRHYHSSSSTLNNSNPGTLNNECYAPIISPLTNDSNTQIPELKDMDQRIAKYFIQDGFFRTINYIQCTIYERRRNPEIDIYMNIYLVTNREFQSLLYIEMLNVTKEFYSNYHTKFYLHSDQTNFRYKFNISNIHYPSNSNRAVVYMIKLYNPVIRIKNNSMKMSWNVIISLFNFCIVFLLIK